LTETVLPTGELSIAESTVTAIVACSSMGFPQSCTQLVSTPELRAKGKEYFLKPDLLQSEIDSLCDGSEQRKLQLCALALVFLNGGSLNMSTLQAGQIDLLKKLEGITKCGGVTYTEDRLCRQVCQAVTHIQDIYLVCTNTETHTYKFSHESVQEAVSCSPNS
jgi:hypothetical protein